MVDGGEAFVCSKVLQVVEDGEAQDGGGGGVEGQPEVLMG